jgi:hypothetical protein
MLEELVAFESGEGLSTGHAPAPASAIAAYFKHVSECPECREFNSFGLCETADALLDIAAGIPAAD